MKLAIFGTSEFAVPTLEALAEKHEIAGVVTQPDRPAGRGHKLVATPVKRAAEARAIPVFTPEKLQPFADQLRALGADAFIVASYGKIVPPSILDIVPIAFNVHPSLLPLYRGATPLQSAIRDGCDETGITIIAMDAGIDTGDVLVQERTPIGLEETYGELHDRLARRGAELALDAVERYANGRLERKPQTQVARELRLSDEEISRTLTRPLRKEDLIVDWTRSPRGVVDQIRSLSPSPAARAASPVPHNQTIKLLAAHVGGLEDARGWAMTLTGVNVLANGAPSAIGRTRDGGLVVLDLVVPPGRGPMSGEAFAQSVIDRGAKMTE